MNVDGSKEVNDAMNDSPNPICCPEGSECCEPTEVGGFDCC
jgi:hypothetical protein